MLWPEQLLTTCYGTSPSWFRLAGLEHVSRRAGQHPARRLRREFVMPTASCAPTRWEIHSSDHAAAYAWTVDFAGKCERTRHAQLNAQTRTPVVGLARQH